jgi:hypothetical protein
MSSTILTSPQEVNLVELSLQEPVKALAQHIYAATQAAEIDCTPASNELPLINNHLMLELLTEIDCSCSHVFVFFYLMPNRLKVE